MKIVDVLKLSKSPTIVVKRGGALGDFILTLPVFAALRQAFPLARLQLIGDPRFLPLARPDAALDHDSPALIPLYSGGDLAAGLAPFFAGCDFFLAYAVDPEGELARRLPQLVGGEVLLCDPRPDGGLHIAHHLQAPLRQLGLPVPEPIPRLHLQPAERAYAMACWQERRLTPPLVLVHPGSGGRRKCWPLGQYLELVHQLSRQGLQVLLLHGPVESDLVARIHRDPHCRTLTLCPPGLLELAGLLETSALFIGNDCGPGHLAAALGTPTLSLFGPTDPAIWKPLHPRAQVIQAPAGELEAVSVEEVLTCALAMLGSLSQENGGITLQP